MDREIFKDHTDYWQVADNIRDIYMSDGSLTTLLDFERVLDEVDIYADRKSTRLNSSHSQQSRMPSSA